MSSSIPSPLFPVEVGGVESAPGRELRSLRVEAGLGVASGVCFRVLRLEALVGSALVGVSVVDVELDLLRGVLGCVGVFVAEGEAGLLGAVFGRDGVLVSGVDSRVRRPLFLLR